MKTRPRRRAPAILTTTALAISLTALPGLAADWALLVGVWDYQDPELRLDAPPNDLELVRSLLGARGIPGGRVRLLANPTKAEITGAFGELSDRLEPSDSLLFYFSGHGTHIIDKFGTSPGDEASGRYPDRDDEALLPVDADLAVPSTYLLDDELNGLLRAFRAQRITCVIDTCYSGDILREVRLGKSKGAPGATSTVDVDPEAPAMSCAEDVLDDSTEFALLVVCYDVFVV